MTRYEAEMFISRLLQDGFMRGHLEKALGYDTISEIRDKVAKGAVCDVKPLTDYLKEVCGELSGK